MHIPIQFLTFDENNKGYIIEDDCMEILFARHGRCVYTDSEGAIMCNGRATCCCLLTVFYCVITCFALQFEVGEGTQLSLWFAASCCGGERYVES